MKALKTIVATAVIVFALTTVAMAGARHVAGWGDTAGTAAGPAAPQTHHDTGVTLTDDQYARLLHALNDHVAQPHPPKAANDHASTSHAPQADREMSRDRARDHSGQTTGDTPNHARAQQRTQTHRSSAGTHDGDDAHNDVGTHDGGTQGGGTHEDGGTHDDGSHDGGSHDDGGAHDGGGGHHD
jgi:hypothetical protein